MALGLGLGVTLRAGRRGGSAPLAVHALLQENGFSLLQENSSFILLEDGNPFALFSSFIPDMPLQPEPFGFAADEPEVVTANETPITEMVDLSVYATKPTLWTRLKQFCKKLLTRLWR